MHCISCHTLADEAFGQTDGVHLVQIIIIIKLKARTNIISSTLIHLFQFYQRSKGKCSCNFKHTYIDTRFCTHDLIKEDDWNDHPCAPKIMIALHASNFIYLFIYLLLLLLLLLLFCINLFIVYHKNDLEVLTVTTMCPVSKSDHRIERYRMIKFA